MQIRVPMFQISVLHAGNRALRSFTGSSPFSSTNRSQISCGQVECSPWNTEVLWCLCITLPLGSDYEDHIEETVSFSHSPRFQSKTSSVNPVRAPSLSATSLTGASSSLSQMAAPIKFETWPIFLLISDRFWMPQNAIDLRHVAELQFWLIFLDSSGEM
jgi:hypothetical protein